MIYFIIKFDCSVQPKGKGVVLLFDRIIRSIDREIITHVIKIIRQIRDEIRHKQHSCKLKIQRINLGIRHLFLLMDQWSFMNTEDLLKFGKMEILEVRIGRKTIRVETYGIGPCNLG